MATPLRDHVRNQIAQAIPLPSVLLSHIPYELARIIFSFISLKDAYSLCVVSLEMAKFALTTDLIQERPVPYRLNFLKGKICEICKGKEYGALPIFCPHEALDFFRLSWRDSHRVIRVNRSYDTSTAYMRYIRDRGVRYFVDGSNRKQGPGWIVLHLQGIGTVVLQGEYIDGVEHGPWYAVRKRDVPCDVICDGEIFLIISLINSVPHGTVLSKKLGYWRIGHFHYGVFCGWKPDQRSLSEM